MADCAILAVASATGTVHALLQRLPKAPRPRAPAVPWTIVNRYYTAEVCFLVHPLSSWHAIRDALAAPALLFVWHAGEPYRDQIRTLAQRPEFEVALAVRLPPAGSDVPPQFEDDQEIDAYLSSKGFEFIDVPDVDAPPSDRTGIPGIPRIVDALSTIMWPSMIRRSSVATTRTALANLGTSSGDYHNLVRFVGDRISGNDGDHMRRELEELERWFDQDALSSDDEAIPWSTAVTPGTLSPSLSGFLDSPRPATPKAGFDDDFASFISAPSASPPPETSENLSFRVPPVALTSFSSTFSFDSLSGRSTPIFDDHATPLAPRESYKPLGSVSDFGNPDEESVRLERLSSGSDGDMPTRAEIAATPRRIFGGMPLSLSPTQERGDGDGQRVTILGETLPQAYPDGEVDVEMTDADLDRFDLQNVLGALHGLKEEIAGMPDKERREAAARVALGLAYGLGGDPHSEASEELAS